MDINNNTFTQRERYIVYSLLYRVMNADSIQKPEEIDFLNKMQQALSMSSADVTQSEELSVDECKRALSMFDDDKRKYIKELLEEMAIVDGVYVEQEKELISSLKLDISHYELELIADWRDKDQKVIGFYTQKDDGRYSIEDIRSLGFSERTYKDGSEISIEIASIPSQEVNEYYEFAWTIELDESERGFRIVPKDNNFKIVKPKELVDRLYQKWRDSDPDIMDQMSNVQKMVNTQLTASSDGTFVYELLQNANDYPVKIGEDIQLVDVEFHLTDHYLIYRHTGRFFSPRNIAAISKISAGEKKKEKNAIGYKGIGFKTVFSENQYVFLESGDYTIRFDESITKESRRFPWQIMPIWTPRKEVAKEVLDVMSSHDEFRVQMAIRPDDTTKLREGEKSFEYIFNDIFKDEKDILFIPNINSVKVFYDGEEKISRTKDPEKWALTREPLVYKFSKEEIDENNDEIGKDKRIPEKYKDFEDTRVSFACQRQGRTLIPVEKARIYCYLPTQVSLGFPFLMNTDMIPTGPRDDFEKKINFNHRLITIAGGKLAEWISTLIKSGEFDQASVFDIIPSFNKVENYEVFIEEFENGFDTALETLEWIPTVEGKYTKIADIIVDETGLTSSDILSDEEFYKFSGLEGVLPSMDLRNNNKVHTFAKKYIDRTKSVFNTKSLKTMLQSEEFIEWLKVQENNNKFLNFLLEKKLLKDFLDEDIFIEDECGKLFSSADLYYDVDEHLVDLQAFSEHICYLSLATREYFKTNEQWKAVTESSFAKFEPESFVISTLLSDENKKATVANLTEKDTSLHFYHFIAKNKIVNDVIKDLPFISSSNGEAINDFKDKFVFFASKIGESVCKSAWLSNVSIAFVSDGYDPIVLEYFKDNIGVQTYSNEIIVKDIIIQDNYRKDIQSAINDDYDISEDFVKFCYNNKSLFTSGSLGNYALNVADKKGDFSFIIPNDDEVFLPSSLYDDYSEKEWLDDDWMYCLDNNYIKNCSVGKTDEFKKFMSSAFYVTNITDENFYKCVVRKHIKEINSNITDKKDPDGIKNVDFIKYLDDNYKLIFEDLKDADLFASITLVSKDCCDIRESQSNVYVYDDELKELLDKDWFPAGIAEICTNQYGDSKALIAIRAKKYVFSEFFTYVIIPNITAINTLITTKELSIDFHQSVIDHKGQIPTDEIVKMRSAKIYLLDKTDPVDSSTGHAILSSTAKELAAQGLVEFSQLNIIDPAYNAEANTDYWKTNLGNSDFTISNFQEWLNDNVETFASTVEDETKNITFWRWAKTNLSGSALNNLPELPILLTEEGTKAKVSDVIYLADCYVDEGGVEGYVRKFDANANFLSSKYLQGNDDIKEWQLFWTSIGVKSEIIDILISTIIPRLDEIDEPTLPATLVKYQDKLEKVYEDLPASLTKLRVKAHDGNFYPLADCVYINCTEQKEPFTFIEIPNQITFSSGEERALIKQILEKLSVKFIDNSNEWRHAKIDSYLKKQDDLEHREDFKAIHYAFFNELAEMREHSIDALNEYKQQLDKVLILDEDEEYVDPKTLTMSSVYNPFCDFQAHGIDSSKYTSIKYISNTYQSCCMYYVGKVMRFLGIHNDFIKNDIQYLANREFSYYFWTKYLQSKANKNSLDKLAEYISSKEFGDIACIPTKDYMKKPCDLYSPAISNFVRKTEDWENKLPIESIPDILYKEKTLFDLLPFKQGLSFPDCLYALFKVKNMKTRPTLVRWAIDDYKADYEIKVDEYREDEDALWTNTKNKPIQIRSLYALEQGNNTLEQFFKDLDRILNPAYINASDFTKACEIFKIKTITEVDLIVEPNNAVDVSAQLKHRLRLSALVLAGRYDIDTWQDAYVRYDELIERMILWRCDLISVRYKDDAEISQSYRRFYFKKETSEFYFVQNIDAKLVFTDFVAAFKVYLSVPSDFNNDIVNEIMNDEESALNMITNDLKLNEDFMNQLDAIIPGKKREMIGVQADDNDDLEDLKRHTYTAHLDSEDATTPEEDETQPTESSTEETSMPQSDTRTVNPREGQSRAATSSMDDTDIPGYSDQHSQSSPTNPYGQVTKKPGTLHSGATSTSSYKKKVYPSGPRVEGSKYPYTKNDGWVDTSRTYRPSAPRPFSPEDVRNFGSNGHQRILEVLQPTQVEVDTINRLLDGDLSSEQVADQNYLAQYRLYHNLVDRGMIPDESETDFVRNAHLKNEHTLRGGKYIHKCSAAGGIMYLSPSIWNKIADDRCVVCVYLGAKANEFMYFNSIEEILEWVREDDIIIKLTGEEKADVVQELYSGILKGVKGTAYTMIRVGSNEKYNSAFAPMTQDPNENKNLTDDDI